MVSSPIATLTRPHLTRGITNHDARIPPQVELELRACLENRSKATPINSQVSPSRSMAQAVDGVISAVDGVLAAATSPSFEQDPIVEEILSPVDKRQNQGSLLEYFYPEIMFFLRSFLHGFFDSRCGQSDMRSALPFD